MKIVSGRTGTPHVTSQQFRQFIEGTVGQESYIITSGENLEPELASNNLLKIRSGMMCHHGNISSVDIGTYDQVSLTNGSQGMKRIDLVVNRYTKNKETNVESNSWVVIQGTPAASNPTVPSYTKGNLQNGDLVDDCPVFKIHYDGISVTQVEKLLGVLGNLAEINSKIEYQLTPSWSNPTYKIYRRNGVVYINYYCGVSGGQAATAYKVATLPSGIAPTNTIKSQAWCANSDGKRYSASIEIQPSGVIKFVSGNVFVEAGFTVSYPL
mgnify:CR=1 FL=1